ncbi:ribonuclease E/G [Microcoleus sp. FACHB-SPT15]|uniref:Rne/Rng family ribonuclease n=1 Tax=Microcoleus sp. FACHB-SPT15 TaxID=2692830 RepID=UPI00177E874A|nr:Rne/Rng family ribonuclease [Microcoleus sp. FACHB-SPT15]MBD1809943.1 ribonuclease E/G [Microcoleus sp. FACHB-SPT15]
MPKQIIIAEQHRLAAVFWEDQIQELVVATGSHQVGDIYLGVVENVLPGIDAAFVNIGDSERNGFIHVTDLGPLRLKRSAGAITELLTPQQKVLVQVMKEPTGNKGPRLTGNISLPGRYLVMMPYGRGVNLSRRIKSDSERNRLRALAVLLKPAGMGLLVRTEAEGRAEEAIIEDLEALQKQWEAVQQEANSTRAPALLNRDDDFIQRVLRDMYTADVNRIVVDSHTGVKRVKQHLVSWSGGRSPEGVLIDHHRDRLPILDYFRVNAAIREALKPRVDLPSGGYIIIEPTEALTVIDVNSGSFTRSATARETVLWTNCEAATEIARQLRLRNLAGVIIVDFIDMDARRDQLQVLEHFNKALKGDKARPQIAQLSELGLVELTRKRQGQNIYELFGQPCPTCGGLGHLVRLPGESDRQVRELAEPSAIPLVARETRLPDLSDPLDFAPVDDNEENDLVHHPSYQERGLANNKNRRTRRRRLDEPVAKEEFIPTKVNPRIISVPQSRSEPMLEPDNLSEVARDSVQTTPKEVGVTGRGLVTESPIERIAKPQLIKAPREIEPPEVIAIEMTPEEQDVYALMGISPLIRLNREVKNPKSVILSVVLPGESNDAETLNEASVESASEASTLPSATDDGETSPMSVTPSGEAATLDESPSSAQVLVTSPTEVSTTEISTEPTDELDGSRPIIRRRRRRSSAVEGDDSSAL